MALPATLLKAADVIDNPWQIASDRSIKAGIGNIYDQTRGVSILIVESNELSPHLVLADVLEKKVHGKRPCTLASRIIFNKM